MQKRTSIMSRRTALAAGAVGGGAVGAMALRSRLISQDDQTELTTISTPGMRHSDHIPDLTFYTQSNQPVRLYNDLIRDSRVLVSFMYVHCDGVCPATSALFKRLRGELAQHFDNVKLISITLDPERDTPQSLKEYAAFFNAADGTNPQDGQPPWYFLTGTPAATECARIAFGYQDPDPVIDQDREQHAGLFTFGNDSTNRWCTFPVLMSFDQSLAGVLRFLGTSSYHRYACIPRPENKTISSSGTPDQQPFRG